MSGLRSTDDSEIIDMRRRGVKPQGSRAYSLTRPRLMSVSQTRLIPPNNANNASSTANKVAAYVEQRKRASKGVS